MGNRMKKRVLSIATAIILVVVTIGVTLFLNQDVTKVFAAEYREGYILAPTQMDAAGVAIDSAFVFKADGSNDALSLEELKQVLTISPSVEYTLSEQEEGIVITPKQSLQPNTTYIFTIKGITWAYRTEAKFEVLGHFPRHQTTNVPINTGIEFTFNYEGANVKDYFEIEPKVKGSFERHGRVVAFVPKELKKQTIYTVTLKAGLPLEGSDKTLEKDVQFSFETQSDQTLDASTFYMNFESFMHEFAESEVPSLEWNYYFDDTKIKEATVDVEVFAYRDADQFTKDIKDYTDIPMWSYYGMLDAKISTKGLERVMDFEQTIAIENNYPNFLELPNTLDAGYYMVQATYEDMVIHTFMQVTDLSFYYQGGDNEDVFWIHDLSNQEPVNHAKVKNLDTNTSVETNVEGLARITKDTDEKMPMFYHLTSQENEAVLYNFQALSEPYYFGGEAQEYWSYFKPDRNLYKPDDTVNFFGFVRHRYDGEQLAKLSVELTRGRAYYWGFIPGPMDELSYVTKTVTVEQGFFDGQLALPNLKEGGYQLLVKRGDEVISSTYIQVENYMKPSYKIEAEKDHEALFVGDTLEYTIATNFFEGTPVSFLDYNYTINGVNHKEGSGTTEASGEAKVSFTPEYQAGTQGEQNYSFSAYASLPESGSIYVNDYFRVFFNDIHVKPTGTIYDNEGSIALEVHNITLDRLNDGSAENDYDFLSEPVDNHKLEGTVYRNEWIKTETGEYYDYINKEVKKRYRYDLKTTEFDTFTVTTDAKGQAQYTLELPEERSVYYTAEVKTYDHKNRQIVEKVYFGREYEPYPNDGDWYHLETDQENYRIHDDVEINFMNNDDLHTQGRYLFITGQNGIKTVDILTEPTYSMIFEAGDVPNIEVKGIFFNGSTYVEAAQTDVRFDYMQREIDLTITADAPSYYPGDTVGLSIQGTYVDDQGNRQPVSDGVVNISLVDEALFALSDMQIDPLSELYRSVSGGFGMSYGSHHNQNDGFARYDMGFGSMVDEAVSEESSMDTASGSIDKNSSAIEIRQEFKDTAKFMSVKLDSSGKAKASFELPDNVTSWRLMAAAISESLNAGSQVENVNVSLPFFLNTSLSSTYLIGDRPMIGVTGYGNALKPETMIDYVVTLKKANQIVATYEATGKAFERANIPLGTFSEAGSYEVTITGKTDTGASDGLVLAIEVQKSYHEQRVSDIYPLNENTQIRTTDQGETVLTFIDQGRGQYLPLLYRMAYSGGKRVDQKYLANKVKQLLNTTYNQEVKEEQVNLTDYQTDQGGMAILPYAEADVEISALMLPMIQDEVDVLALSKYFENAWYDAGRVEKGAVLYGQAMLDEPILLDLQTYASTEPLSLKDQLYIGLAYAAIGDTYKAKQMYHKVVEGRVTSYEEQAFIQADTEAMEYELTALAMLLASKTEQSEHEKFYTYIVTHTNKDVLVSSHLYQYILDQLEGLETTTGQVTYAYGGQEKTITLDQGWAQTLTLPSATLSQLKILKVEGDMAVTATYMSDTILKKPQEENVRVSRKYYNYQTGEEQTTFKEGDIVKVVLDWEIDQEAIDDSYQLTDYVPSGLKAIESPWQLGLRHDNMYWYRDIEGQKVRFYIYKPSDKYNESFNETEFSYYARITSPGVYTAESPIIQGIQVKDSVYIGERGTITIE